MDAVDGEMSVIKRTSIEGIKAVVAMLKDKIVRLLANYGVLDTGKSVSEAIEVI